MPKRQEEKWTRCKIEESIIRKCLHKSKISNRSGKEKREEEVKGREREREREREMEREKR